MEAKDCEPVLIEDVLGCAFEVHSVLGPGLLESIYEQALLVEMGHRGISAKNQVEIPIYYRDELLGIGYRADIVVTNCLILELKSVARIESIHIKQLVTYLKLMNIKRGLVLNFNTVSLKDGIRRVSV